MPLEYFVVVATVFRVVRHRVDYTLVGGAAVVSAKHNLMSVSPRAATCGLSLRALMIWRSQRPWASIINSGLVRGSLVGRSGSLAGNVGSSTGCSGMMAFQVPGNACLSCGHFATDRTHLDELRNQLTSTEELLAQRRRLFAERTGRELTDENIWVSERLRKSPPYKQSSPA